MKRSFDRQIEEEIAAIERPTGATLAKGIGKLFRRLPQSEWRDHVASVVERLLADVQR